MGVERGPSEWGELFLEAAIKAVRRHRAGLKGPQDAQDAVNEVAKRLVPYTNRIPEIGTLGPLALKIARNLEVDRIRRDSLAIDLTYSDELLGRIEGPAPESRLRPRDPHLVTELARIISHLPAECQEVFRLRVLDGRTFEQIAIAISVPETSVRRLFREAVHTVKVCLETRVEDDEGLRATIQALGFDVS
jgi:RNA polymerase sigma factor (sigma-70 family)